MRPGTGVTYDLEGVRGDRGPREGVLGADPGTGRGGGLGGGELGEVGPTGRAAARRLVSRIWFTFACTAAEYRITRMRKSYFNGSLRSSGARRHKRNIRSLHGPVTVVVSPCVIA